MWEWRVWLPLSKETPADITALLGADIEVEQSDELHYKVSDTSVDLRRVHVKTQKHARAWEGNGSKGESLMLLRVRRGLKWTTCIERWVAISKLSLRDEDFLTEELDERVLAWLARNGVTMEHRPQTVAVCKRTLIASLPDEQRLSHLLLEQSDLEANGRMWRSVCVRGSSPEQVHRYVLSLREHLLSAGLVASNPVFVRMCLRTESDKIGLSQAALPEGGHEAGAPTGGGRVEAEAEGAEAVEATDDESAAFLAKHLSAGLHLEQAWLESNSFSLRLWRQTKWPGWEQPRPPMSLPPSPARPGSGGVVPGVVPGVAREPQYARPDDPQFPREVMRAALGRAAAAGDAVLVSKLLVVRGVDVNAHCGLGDTPLHTALHFAGAQPRLEPFKPHPRTCTSAPPHLRTYLPNLPSEPPTWMLADAPCPPSPNPLRLHSGGGPRAVCACATAARRARRSSLARRPRRAARGRGLELRGRRGRSVRAAATALRGRPEAHRPPGQDRARAGARGRPQRLCRGLLDLAAHSLDGAGAAAWTGNRRIRPPVVPVTDLPKCRLSRGSRRALDTALGCPAAALSGGAGGRAGPRAVMSMSGNGRKHKTC